MTIKQLWHAETAFTNRHIPKPLQLILGLLILAHVIGQMWYFLEEDRAEHYMIYVNEHEATPLSPHFYETNVFKL